MKITKFGHSCLLVEEKGSAILFDPGAYSDVSNNLENINAVFLTHNHQDHTDPEKIKNLEISNPKAVIYANENTGQTLTENGIHFTNVEYGKVLQIGEISVEVFANNHENIFPGVPLPENTSYLVNNKLFIPGDSLVLPNTPVEILALPIIAPWMNLGQAINFALAIKPKICFPVHDAFLKFPGPYEALPKNILEKQNIQFTPLANNEPREF